MSDMSLNPSISDDSRYNQSRCDSLHIENDDVRSMSHHDHGAQSNRVTVMLSCGLLHFTALDCTVTVTALHLVALENLEKHGHEG